MDFYGGDDTATLDTGSTINGTLDGGAGTDTLNLRGSGFFGDTRGVPIVANAMGFEILDMDGGLWSVALNSSITGLTEGRVREGGLQVDGFISANSFIVEDGGRLSGLGVIQSPVSILNGGVLGSNFLNVPSIVFAPNATYEVLISENPGVPAPIFTRLDVTGEASLGGTVAVSVTDDSVADILAIGQEGVIVDAASITGAFSQVRATGNLARRFSFDVNYNEDVGDVILVVQDVAGAGGKLGNALIATQPNDPVGGTPASAISLAAASDFAAATGTDGFSDPETDFAMTSSAGGRTGLQPVVAGVQYGAFRAAKTDVDVYAAPIRYSFRLPPNPLRMTDVKVSVPIAITETDGNRAVTGSLGVSPSFAAVPGLWRLTPGLRVGLVQSDDLNVGAWTLSASLTNELALYRGLRRTVRLANTIGLHQARDTEVLRADTIGYETHNTIYRTGVIYNQRRLWRRAWDGQLFFAYTSAHGDTFFVDEYTEIGGAVVSARRSAGLVSRLRLGLTGSFADDYSGASLNLGATF